MAKGIDWIKIRTEYETSNISYRKLAEKYKVVLSTLEKRAKRESWVKSKENTCGKIAVKLRQKTADKIVDRNAKILSISDKLANKIEQAVEQLENYIVTNKVKTKTITYGESGLKPTKEVITEVESLEVLDGLIDKQGLKFLTTALRDIKELQPKEEITQDELPDDGFMDAMKEDTKNIWADETDG